LERVNQLEITTKKAQKKDKRYEKNKTKTNKQIIVSSKKTNQAQNTDHSYYKQNCPI